MSSLNLSTRNLCALIGSEDIEGGLEKTGLQSAGHRRYGKTGLMTRGLFLDSSNAEGTRRQNGIPNYTMTRS